jgi:hypothetical protein
MNVAGNGSLILKDGRHVTGCFNLAERRPEIHNLIFLPLNFDGSLMKAEAISFIDEENRFEVSEIKISRRNYNGETTLWCACKIKPVISVTNKRVNPRIDR